MFRVVWPKTSLTIKKRPFQFAPMQWGASRAPRVGQQMASKSDRPLLQPESGDAPGLGWSSGKGRCWRGVGGGWRRRSPPPTLTTRQGRVILGGCQLLGCPEPSQCGAARRQEGGGMKHSQDRKQSQQVTWQVQGELCNESRGMWATPSPSFFFLRS